MGKDDSGNSLGSAKRLYDQGRFREARIIYEKLAIIGLIEAKCFVGWMYLEGIGVEIDVSKAHVFLEEASAEGCMTAGFLVGKVFEKKRDFHSALEVYKRNILLGGISSNYRIGLIYKDVFKENHKALPFFQEGATHGHIPSMIAYARMMRSGQGYLRFIYGWLLSLFYALKIIWVGLIAKPGDWRLLE